MKYCSMAASRGMVKFETGLRSTRSESLPGAKYQSLRRTSNPPPVGGAVPAAIWMAEPVTDEIVRPARFANTVTAVSACCGSQTSFGTVDESFIDSASAQSLANSIVYFVRSGEELPASMVTARTTRFALTPVETASTASTSPGQMSCGVCRLKPVYFPDQEAARLVARASSVNAAFSQSAELLAAGLITLPVQRAVPGIVPLPSAVILAALARRATERCTVRYVTVMVSLTAGTAVA